MKIILQKLFEHQTLEQKEAQKLLYNIAKGEYNSSQIASLITTFLMRSITVEELNGFKEALLNLRVILPISDFDVIDIVGTGGDGKNTFNISTTSSFVVAGAGYKVVKHGNVGMTSISGASNLMQECGVKFSTDADKIKNSLDKSNIAYLHAPLFNPAMKVVSPIRKELGVRTLFNILGPLINPILPKYQLLGVYNLSLLKLYTYTYQTNSTNFCVVHSLDGYDEISLTDQFMVANRYGEHLYTPSELNLPFSNAKELEGGSTPQEASKIFFNILNNKATPSQTNTVIANAAFAIHTMEANKSLEECIDLARNSITSGKTKNAFQKFIQLNS